MGSFSNMIKSAADKGLVGATNQAGVKKLSGTIKNKYTHEIKVKGKYGAYRIYGYRRANGQWVFDYFCKAHKQGGVDARRIVENN